MYYTKNIFEIEKIHVFYENPSLYTSIYIPLNHIYRLLNSKYYHIVYK